MIVVSSKNLKWTKILIGLISKDFRLNGFLFFLLGVTVFNSILNRFQVQYALL